MDLGEEILEEEWRFWCILIKKLTCNFSLREHYYKLHHQRYLTPSRMARMYAESVDKCDIHAYMVELLYDKDILANGTEADARLGNMRALSIF